MGSYALFNFVWNRLEDACCRRMRALSKECYKKRRCPMPKIIDFDLPESLANTLKAYAVKTKANSLDQSQIVEAALIEFFEKRGVRVDT